MSTLDQTKLTSQVMQKIRSGEVQMRPRLYFALGAFLLGVGLALAVLVTIFFVNLVVFRLRSHSPFGFLWFGRHGVGPFLMILPWAPAMVAISGISTGIYLLRRFNIFYRESLVSLGLVLIVAVVTLGFLLDRVGFNEQVRHLRPLRPLYSRRLVGPSWVAGELLEVRGDAAVVQTLTGTIILVKWDQNTWIPPGMELEKGDSIRVIGKKQNGSKDIKN